MKKTVDRVLEQLKNCIENNAWIQLETEALEIKPIPADGGQWKEIYKSVNAFLNTRGGILIFGIQEKDKKYYFTGYRPEAEPKLKEIATLFTDKVGNKLNLIESFPSTEIRGFLNGQIAVLYIEELSPDRKYCFYNKEAFKRVLTGDHRLSEIEISAQEEYREEVLQARELVPVDNVKLEQLDLDRLNEYIQLLNKQVKIETIKPDINSALPFLVRKGFIKDNVVTTLGMLVCGSHPADYLEFRCQVVGYVNMPGTVVGDKQVMSGNILPLMEESLAFVLRNIQVGVSAEGGGISKPQYPEELLRETVNNALAHRDYSVNKFINININPGQSIEIRNPGSFRKHFVINEDDFHRIIPDAKPRNPKLAMVLMVYSKWEGKGIGMATLVNLCLQNLIDLPYYRFYSDNDLGLFLCAGKLYDEEMERYFQSFDGYIENKLNGNSLTESQLLILSYLIKSEWADLKQQYTILLTPENNHFSELIQLEKAGLIIKHAISKEFHPVYVVDREIMKDDYSVELKKMFGNAFISLDPFRKKILNVIYRFNNYAKVKYVSARQASIFLWYHELKTDDLLQFDAFLRKTRYFFNTLQKSGFLIKAGKESKYELNSEYLKTNLL